MMDNAPMRSRGVSLWHRLDPFDTTRHATSRPAVDALAIRRLVEHTQTHNRVVECDEMWSAHRTQREREGAEDGIGRGLSGDAQHQRDPRSQHAVEEPQQGQQGQQQVKSLCHTYSKHTHVFLIFPRMSLPPHPTPRMQTPDVFCLSFLVRAWGRRSQPQLGPTHPSPPP